jgi:hypothetical protein
MTVFVLVTLVVVATTIWVGIDADNLGVYRGCLGGGLFDTSISGWVICCLLFWIVAFPSYLVTRRRYEQMPRPIVTVIYPDEHVTPPGWGSAPPTPQAASPAQANWATPNAYPTPPPPPQTSPDGRWWWDGAQWNPVPVVGAPAPQRPVHS